nr:RNA polymerase sigma factor SigI [Bacillus benzoevorans]
MLSLLFMARKRKRKLEEQIQLIQQGDLTLHNELIDSYRPFIAKTVSSVCKRYIHESDDEFSIGLIAFNEAIQKYDSEKGASLISFSELLIKRRVIDYIRSQSKYETVSLDNSYKACEDEYEGTSIETELSFESFKRKTDENLRKEEILQFTEVMKQFDLSFQDLLENSPKHEDARRNAIMTAKILTENEKLITYFLEKKRLPIKELEGFVPISRKTIERNRKYIIAISLILIGDYVYLKDYLKGVLET